MIHRAHPSAAVEFEQVKLIPLRLKSARADRWNSVPPRRPPVWRKIWIDVASRRPARGRPVALLYRGVTAVDVVAPISVGLQAGRIIRIVGLSHHRRGARQSRSKDNPNQCCTGCHLNDSKTRSNAGCLRFLILIQCFCLPPRHGRSRCLLTSPLKAELACLTKQIRPDFALLKIADEYPIRSSCQ
jgi:hypothetical protein